MEHWLNAFGFASVVYGAYTAACQEMHSRQYKTTRRENIKGGSESTLYTPAKPGPLTQSEAETFTGGSYTETILAKDTGFIELMAEAQVKSGDT